MRRARFACETLLVLARENTKSITISWTFYEPVCCTKHFAILLTLDLRALADLTGRRLYEQNFNYFYDFSLATFADFY